MEEYPKEARGAVLHHPKDNGPRKGLAIIWNVIHYAEIPVPQSLEITLHHYKWLNTVHAKNPKP